MLVLANLDAHRYADDVSTAQQKQRIAIDHYFDAQCSQYVEELKCNPQSPEVVHVRRHDFAQQIEFHPDACHHLLIHADNAVGQNKNNTVLGYLAWRVFTGRNCSISFHLCYQGIYQICP